MTAFPRPTSISALRTWAFSHKIISGVIVVVIVGGGYFAYTTFSGGAKETRYVLGTVGKGTVIETVSGTGQVSAENQIDLTAKAAGDLVSITVKAGDTVRAGQTIAVTDLGDTEFQYESAKISYDKAVAQNAQTTSSANTSLENSSNSAIASGATESAHMLQVLTTLADLYSINGYLSLNKNGLTDAERSYRSRAGQSYDAANGAFKAFQTKYALVSARLSSETIATMLSDEYTVSTTVVQAAKDAQDAIGYFREQESPRSTASDTEFTSIQATVNTATGALSSLSLARTSFTTALQGVQNLSGSLGTIDVRSAELSLRQARDNYTNHFVVAPFDGVIAKVSGKVGSPSGTSVATLITKQQLAQITLNEVDVSKIKAGQKVVLTFDAIDSLSITGTVAEVDGVGTVSQGVVSYAVKIGFDTQDAHVMPGMTANADIQVSVMQDALTVPASAVKTLNGTKYVLAPNESVGTSTEVSTGATGVLLASSPKQIPVETGITDGTNVVITSGLTEGEQIIMRSVTATATKSTAASATTRGGGFGGGGAVRIP